MSLLQEIVRSKKEELRTRQGKARLAELKAQIRDNDPPRPFADLLSKPPLRLIAEIKKASPSAGLLRDPFDPVAIARTYHESGATALSILTDRPFFQGALATMANVRRSVPVPILQKDFLLDEIQCYEARAYGADAILLIAAILEPRQMVDLFHLADSLGMAALVEVHSEKELERVIEWAPIIGINNRDLTTFNVDLETTFRILPEVPEEKIIVSESGIATREDVKKLEAVKVHAILVGEVFMRAPDIAAKVKELMGTHEES